MVEKKLKGHGLVVECAHLPETVTLLDELEDASRRGVLYGIIISSQHEVHHSVTVHILHGTQQGKLMLCCAQGSTFNVISCASLVNGYLFRKTNVVAPRSLTRGFTIFPSEKVLQNR